MPQPEDKLVVSDTDTELTTEEEISPDTSPKKVIMSADLTRAKKGLKSLDNKVVLQEVRIAEWTTAAPTEQDLIVVRDRMKDYNVLFENVYDAILHNTSDTEFTAYNTELSGLQKRMDLATAKVSDRIRDFEISRINQQAAGGGTSPPKTSQVRVPKLDLPSFNGSSDDWNSFQNLFTSAIIKNTNLTDSQRLQYLSTCLTGEALQVIKGFSISDANFVIAWDLLKVRYDNKRDLIFGLIKRFLHQMSVTKESPKNIRKLIDTSLECYRSLEALKEPVDTWKSILVFVVVEKLDPDSRREWTKTLKGNDIPTFQETIDFLECHVRGLLAAGVKSMPGTQSSSAGGVKTNSHHASNVKPKLKCYFCSETHVLGKCGKFAALGVPEREKFIKSKRLCLNCFSAGHMLDECRSTYSCSECQGKHNSLLHRARTPAPTTTVSNVSGGTTSHNSVLLSTAMVKVKDSHGEYKLCRVLLDPGSESSYVTDKCVRELGLKPSKCNVEITGITSMSIGKAKGVLNLNISSILRNFNFDANCLVFSKVTGRLPSFSCVGHTWDYLAGLSLADPDFLEPREVDILLGAEVTGFLSLPGRVMRDRLSPIASETELGWVVSGPVGKAGLKTSTSCHFSIRAAHSKLETDALLQRFWELEEVPQHPQWTAEEKQCERIFLDAHSREQGGRYVAPLPFNTNISGLGASRHMAVKRLEQVERRLSRGPHAEQYAKFMREYEDLGHMSVVQPEECGEVIGKTNFLPHHFVLREESTTTKLRVVFDGSAKTSSGLSLNNCLLVGPKVQDDLFVHLLRFRLNPIALKADIVKMFRQFSVSRSDSDFQRIVWRESPSHLLKEYRLATVTYGTASAPHSAARCLKQLSLDYMAEYPEAAEIFGRNFYVDDLLVSVKCPEEAVRIQKGLDLLASKAEMEIGKWDSNDPRVLEHVPLVSRAKNSNFKMEDNQFVSKALGVGWDSVNDNLLFQGFEFKNIDRVTKRIVLSEMSRIFDPLGLLAPVSVKVKIFFQQLWKPFEFDGSSHKLDWDDLLPESLQADWDSYQHGMSKINEVQIPRVLCLVGTQQFELHGFSDASESAYSAVLYFRSFGEDGSVKTRLVCAKTKVAPLKSQSIPKLELCGALLLSRLVTAFVEATGIKCPIYAWTDSELVLKWISGSSRRWKTFVANRVAEIQEALSNESWRFIPGEINPADCASRGMTVEELLDFDLWWRGPDFLSCPGIPVFVGKEIPADMEIERKSKCLLTLQVTTNFWFTRFSDLNRLKRILAYVMRFRHNCCVKSSDRVAGELTVSELGSAFTCLVKLAQREDFGVELDRLESGKRISTSSRLITLNPFLDKDGVLRVGGRLQRSNAPSSTKHQVILAGSHHLSKLLIHHYHQKLHHAGFQLLWTSMQREFWILRARSSIRNLVRNCLLCKRLKAKVAEQLMGSLPPARVNPSRPFTHVGVDYAGPFSLSVVKGRGNRLHKGYFCIFLCFSTKAVHLEYVLDMTTESFLGALKRFVARRGMSSHIYSDCGTNFIGAEKELANLLSSSGHNNAVLRFLADKGISWHFNSPSAPHHGGLWEAGVKSTKYHLKRIIGVESISLEEFATVLCQVEAALNSRPLCALSPDPADLEVLTPGHFLIGEPLTAIPEPDLTHLKVNRLSRWQRCQQIVQHFWDRWSKEYLHSLQQRNQWKTESENVGVGDLVLIKEDNAPVQKWRLGRVVSVNPGSDKLVRVVTVKTATGELKRPVAKLCPLLSKEDL